MKLIGTASLVKQDRETTAEANGWVIGGVNVISHKRNQGYGTVIMEYLEDILQTQAASEKRSLHVKLIADDAIALILYDSFGFVHTSEDTSEYIRIFTA